VGTAELSPGQPAPRLSERGDSPFFVAWFAGAVEARVHSVLMVGMA
jgi:hypothetical protein